MVTFAKKKPRALLSTTMVVGFCVVVSYALLLILFHIALPYGDYSNSIIFPSQNSPVLNPILQTQHRDSIRPKITVPVQSDPIHPLKPTKTSTAVTANAKANANATSTPKATIAYAWTLAKCSDFQSSTEGMIDAALILKHSVHQVSFRAGKSKYDYRMYVLVHQDAAACTQILKDVGYIVKVLPQPVEKKNIRGEHLRKTVDREVCIF